MSRHQSWGTILLVLVIALLAGGRGHAQVLSQAPAGSQVVGSCDLQALQESEAEFQRLSTLHRLNQSAVTSEDLKQASTDYVAKADACYETLYGGSSTSIDDGGVWFSPYQPLVSSQPFVTISTKWGTGSPFAGGTNVSGPRLPGGTVSYSFMGNGISMAAESADPSLSVTSLPTYSGCFLTEISNAFAAWSAVADIQFVQVADNGAAFNGSGAAGDIRIGAHTFDSPSGVLAHGFYPPPNGTSAAGDLHFDRAENWSCAAGPGLIDIGIVALHEIGHTIGLGHETTNTAVMNPFYNPAIIALLTDDINGASSIYGSPAGVGITGDFDGEGMTDFGYWNPSSGMWTVVRSSDNSVVNQVWGAGYAPYNDVPVPADYDGDGKADIAVWRRSTGTWYVIRSSDGTMVSRAWGAGYAPYNDVAVPGDYDGDGKADFAVWRKSTGFWYVVRSSDGAITSRAWGAGYAPYNDVPVVGDYDGDGKDDTAVWRTSNGYWYVIRSSDGAITSRAWGAGYAPYNDGPVQGDYDGDAKTDLAVWRTSTRSWFVIRSSDDGIVMKQP